MLEEALKEQGVEVFKSDEGFFTYKYAKDENQKFVHIVSGYFKPEHRNQVDSLKCLQKFEDFQKSQDYTMLAWPVNMLEPNKESQLLMCLVLGFKLQNANQERLVLVKQV